MNVLYVAAPLFTAAERAWNAEMATLLRSELPDWNVLLPQEFCAAHEVPGQTPDFPAIYRSCLGHLAGASAVLAVLDGADVDSGTSWECGWAVARGIPVHGLRTDLRPGEFAGANCMLSCSCSSSSVTMAAAVAAIRATAVSAPTERRD